MKLFHIKYCIGLSPGAIKWLRNNHTLTCFSDKKAKLLSKDKYFKELVEKELIYLDEQSQRTWVLFITNYGEQILEQIL
jgi:hypothetical protein